MNDRFPNDPGETAVMAPGQYRSQSSALESESTEPFLTFDLFDTVITRQVFYPHDLFYALIAPLHAENIPIGPADQFAALRHRMDDLVRRRLRVDEITIGDIYDGLAQHLGWTAAQRDKALAIELACEIESVLPIVELRDRLLALSPSHYAIISDSYLSRNFLLRLLDQCGLRPKEDHVFVSSDFGTTKSRRLLYGHVARCLGIPCDKMLHMGDNPRSDIEQAVAAGMRACHFPHSAATDRECRYYRSLSGGTRTRSLLAGALRSGRLQFPGGTEHERAVWTAAADVAAPLLLAYVAWILTEARTRKITRLYFLSRDGQVLLEIAQRLQAGVHAAIPCSYLYASRQGWHLPAITKFDDHVFSWLEDAAQQSSLRTILARVDLTPEECQSPLSAWGATREQWDRPHNDPVKLRALFQQPEMQALILERAQRARSLVTRYLRAEGFGGEDRIGIVDLGWHGRLQQSLRNICDAEAGTKAQPVVGFYFALKSRPAQLAADDLVTFAKGPLWPQSNFVQMCETFCSADHGGVRGFAENADGSVSPVLACDSATQIDQWGYRSLRGGIIVTTEHLIRAVRTLGLTLPETSEILGACARAEFIRFITRPSRAEADAYGCFPFQIDQYHEAIQELAPNATTIRAVTMICLGGNRAGIPNPWKEAVVVRSLHQSVAGLALLILKMRSHLLKLLF